ncbi:MAG: hypothetical protein HQ581_06130 [Planctomycetes bacterium]|nr:hypothetical protein [Planctomycetota bacterium]
MKMLATLLLASAVSVALNLQSVAGPECPTSSPSFEGFLNLVDGTEIDNGATLVLPELLLT